METLFQDLRYALRSLWKSPGLASVAVVSLALGIGANTTIFTLINAVLLHSLPVAEPERLVALYTYDEKGDGPLGAYLTTSYLNFEDFRDKTSVFSHLAAFQIAQLSALIGDEPEQVLGEAVSESYWELLGIRPAVGRFFARDENHDLGRSPVVVLSYSFWNRRFGGDPGVIGRTMTINAQPFHVIGVAPRGFTGTYLLNTPDLWVPMTMHEQILSGPFKTFFKERRALLLWVIGRLKPGVTVAQAQSAVQALAGNLAQQFPDANGGLSAVLLPLTQSYVQPARRGTFAAGGIVLMVVVGLVLLIACANVAHLLMIRAERRRREITVRLAIGVGRARLIRQLMTEGLLLALAGGALGLLLARWCRDLLWGMRPPFLAQAHPNLSFDASVLGLTLALSLATALVFGLVPALRASNPDLATALRGRTEIPGVNRIWSSRSLLVVFQIAVSLVALIISGLFIHSLRQAQAIDPGFAADRLAVLAYNLGTQGYDPERGQQFHRRVLDAARAVPGVRSAALASTRPLSQFGGFQRTVIPATKNTADPKAGTFITTDSVSTDYFSTLGIPIREGRDFTGADRADSRRVAIVNETAARQLWPGLDPIGQRFTLFRSNLFFEVVGVARDSKYVTITENPTPYVYLPLEQNYSENVHLYLSSAGRPAQLLETVRRSLRPLDPGLPFTDLATLSQVLADSLWAPRLGALLLGLFGILALLMAAVGSYGVLSYSVSQRNREIGIRMALGAMPGSVVRLVLRQGMTLVGVGILVGWLAAGFFARFLEQLLFGVKGFDPLTFFFTTLVLGGIALLANLIPASRATAVDPLGVLNSE
ncbi:MAG TPA: ABC transporter permease [Thermoanaerobaculia bacterium]|nr:ABC transporter permease [Thermoanaerobaculia bacterium]